MEVVTLDVANLKDVPSSLRRLADQIESGAVNPSEHAIVVSTSPDGDLSVFGYGAVGDLAHEVGVLHMAAMRLALPVADDF